MPSSEVNSANDKQIRRMLIKTILGFCQAIARRNLASSTGFDINKTDDKKAFSNRINNPTPG
jgi:hypothetical protein